MISDKRNFRTTALVSSRRVCEELKGVCDAGDLIELIFQEFGPGVGLAWSDILEPCDDLGPNIDGLENQTVSATLKNVCLLYYILVVMATR